MEEALFDILFNPITTPLPTRFGLRQGDGRTDSAFSHLPMNITAAGCKNADTVMCVAATDVPVVVSLRKTSKTREFEPHNPDEKKKV